VDAAAAALRRFRVFFGDRRVICSLGLGLGLGSVRFGFDYVKAKKPPNMWPLPAWVCARVL